MNRMLVAATVVVAALVLTTLYTQRRAGQEASPAANPFAQQTAAQEASPAEPAAVGNVPEVYCDGTKMGQLCPTGTMSALDLTLEQRAAWGDAVQEYNRAISDATEQLQAEAWTVLNAAQLTEVERWFAVGVNSQMNQLLAAPSWANGGQQ